MSEKISAAPGEASTSGDVRNSGIRPKANNQNYSRQQDNSYKNSREGYKSRGGRGGRGGNFNNYYDRDGEFYRGNHRYTNQRDESWKNKSYNQEFSPAQDVYAMMSKEQNTVRQRDNDYKNTISNELNNVNQENKPIIGNRNPTNNKHNSVRQRDKSNDYKNPSSNQNRRGSGNFKKYPNGTKDKSFDGQKHKRPKHPVEDYDPLIIGPPKKRPPNKVVGGDQSKRNKNFKNQKSLLNEISFVLVQTKSYPELFSYEQLCEELIQQKPIDGNVTKTAGEVINRPEKPKKKAPFLKNGVKLSNDQGQGNIPNEFKRRRKPGRLTMLNRIRRGIPLDSDDDDDEFMEMRKKQKTGDEKKKKVLELIAKCRLSRERAKGEEKENIVTTKNDDRPTSIPSNKSAISSSEDSDEDYRYKRKSEAHELSDNLSNHLSKLKTKESCDQKDFRLSDLKNIIQSRSRTLNNATVPEQCSTKSDVKDLLKQMKTLDIKGTDTLNKKGDDGHMGNENETTPLEQTITSSANSLSAKDDSEHMRNENETTALEKTITSTANTLSAKDDNGHMGNDNKETPVEKTITSTANTLSAKDDNELMGNDNEETPVEKTITSTANTLSAKDDNGQPTLLKQTIPSTDIFYEKDNTERMGNENDVTLVDKNEETIPKEYSFETVEKNESYTLEGKREYNSKCYEVITSSVEHVTGNSVSSEVSENEAIVHYQSGSPLKVPNTVNDAEDKETELSKNNESNITHENDEVMENEEKLTNEEEEEHEDNDDEQTEEETDEDSDSDDDDEDDAKVKLLKSLSKELLSSGKEANSEQVIALLQEKLKQLSISRGVLAAVSGTQDTGNEHLTAGRGLLGVVDTDVIVVCDDSTDDDDDDDDDEDDDEFPVLIVKS